MEHAHEIWLVRHGETEWSRSGKHTGRTDLPLTEAGRRRAADLAPPLAARAFSAVFSSPLLRASETCRLAGLGDDVKILDDLAEWDYGAFEGRTTNEIRLEVPDWSIWTSPVPRGESIGQVAERAQQVIAKVAAMQGSVALFSHGHLLRILAACWLQLPPQAGRLLALDTGSISVLGYERATRVIRSWNRVF